MKLSELRPCDCCGGKIAPHFYVVRLSQAMVMAKEANAVLGLAQMFGGALGLAEVVAPDADAVKIFGDERKELMHEFFLCQECFMRPLDMAMLMDVRLKEQDK